MPAASYRKPARNGAIMAMPVESDMLKTRPSESFVRRWRNPIETILGQLSAAVLHKSSRKITAPDCAIRAPACIQECRFLCRKAVHWDVEFLREVLLRFRLAHLLTGVNRRTRTFRIFDSWTNASCGRRSCEMRGTKMAVVTKSATMARFRRAGCFRVAL